MLYKVCLKLHYNLLLNGMSNFSLAKEVVEGSSRNLLEAVAGLIASKTLETFPRITAVRVKLWKPNVPLIRSAIDCLGVEIFRNRTTE